MFLVRLLEKQIVIQAISLDIIKKNDHDQIELTEYSRTDAFEGTQQICIRTNSKTCVQYNHINHIV